MSVPSKEIRLLIQNLHCPSCVTQIESIVPLSVGVSVSASDDEPSFNFDGSGGLGKRGKYNIQNLSVDILNRFVTFSLLPLDVGSTSPVKEAEAVEVREFNQDEHHQDYVQNEDEDVRRAISDIVKRLKDKGGFEVEVIGIDLGQTHRDLVEQNLEEKEKENKKTGHRRHFFPSMSSLWASNSQSDRVNFPARSERNSASGVAAEQTSKSDLIDRHVDISSTLHYKSDTCASSEGQVKHLAYCRACQLEQHDSIERSSSFSSSSSRLQFLKPSLLAFTRSTSSSRPRDVENPVSKSESILKPVPETISLNGSHELEIITASSADKRIDLRQSDFLIHGMTCAACTSSIRSALDSSSQPGILDLSISLLEGYARVKHDANLISVEGIKAVVEDCGFEVELGESRVIDVRLSNNVNRHEGINNPHEHPQQLKMTKTLKIKTTLTIEGMTCSSCAATISRALKALSTVSDVNIDILGKIGVVTSNVVIVMGAEMEVVDVESIDEVKKEIEMIKEEIEECGFEARIEGREVEVLAVAKGEEKQIKGMSRVGVEKVQEEKNRTVMIRVDGIYCHHCIDKLNSSLSFLSSSHNSGSIPIFSFTPFSSSSHITTITYTPRTPYTVRSLIVSLSSVNASVFRASIVKPKSLTERSREIQKKEQRLLFTYFLIAFIIAIPTFVIGIVGMMLLSSHHPMRMWLMTPIWGQANRGTTALWVLATLAQFGPGSLFYRRAWRTPAPIRRLMSKLRGRESRPSMKPRHKSGSRRDWYKTFFTFGSMDLLVVLSTSVAYTASVAMMILDIVDSPARSETGSYFDSSVFLIFFILGGRALEAYAKAKTTNAISVLGTLKPATALMICSKPEDRLFDESGLKLDWLVTRSASATDPNENKCQTTPNNIDSTSTSLLIRIATDYLDLGDLVLVRPGDMPAADGKVAEGLTTFDESSLTGESRPVGKSCGDLVFTGTINVSNAVKIQVTAVGQATTLDGIIKAVAEASSKKSRIEKLAERLTGVFVPFIVYMSLLVLIIWLSVTFGGAISPTYLNGQSSTIGGKLFFALEFAIAALVVSCPCGLSLGSPTAQAVGSGLAAKKGVLVNGGGQAFQASSMVTHVVFDKTGTITKAENKVTDAVLQDSESAWRILERSNISFSSVVAGVVRAVEEQSSHPLAQALVRHAKETDSTNVVDFVTFSSEEKAGRGVRATISVNHQSQIEVLIGNNRLMMENGICNDDTDQISQWKRAGNSVVSVAIRKAHTADTFLTVAHFSIGDTIREEAASVIRTLRSQGRQVWMLSGDNKAAANAVALSVGIDENNVFSELLPHEKARRIEDIQNDYVETLQVSRFRYPFHKAGQRAVVMFVGDGLNDAVAISQADVGVALSHGSQGTIASSDFALLNSSLEGILRVLALSKKVYNRQKLNFAWAWIFNLVCIPFAAGAFYAAHQIRLPPVYSALAMSLSSTSVVLSSLAMRWGI